MHHKHHGVMNKYINAFKLNGFTVIQYVYANDSIIFIVEKDYSKKFNIIFDGKVRLQVKIKFAFEKAVNLTTYPEFKELTNVIPKKIDNHIYNSGNICYAPPYRPIYEHWTIMNFIQAVDAMINNYLSKEYVGIGFLKELEHGVAGIKQYQKIKDNLL